jgi:hypothetical protein
VQQAILKGQSIQQNVQNGQFLRSLAQNAQHLLVASYGFDQQSYVSFRQLRTFQSKCLQDICSATKVPNRMIPQVSLACVAD